MKVGKMNTPISLRTLKRQGQLIFMSVPILIYILIFNYAPIWGWLMAFQDYKPAKSLLDQTWVGFKHFETLFSDDSFFRMLRNTIAMSVINIVLGFVTAIVLALLLNEIKRKTFKRTVQTISYLPHFLSWVIVAGMVQSSLSIEDGIVNTVLLKLHIIDSPVFWLGEPENFWGIIGVTNVWKEIGWNTIIYLAAISAIDPSLYEAADIDGASRYQRMWHITLPGIKPIIYILLILAIGHILDVGFELPYLLRNGLVSDTSDTIDIFVILYAFKEGNFALATATGIFKSVINILLLYSANTIARKLGGESLV
jgi:putative aldouronate transport system permease protein